MTRKHKYIAIIPQFADLPRDVVIHLLEYDERFYLSNDGHTIISRFARKDYRYVLLARIPKINYIWSYRYFGGNIISYLISTAFLSKNKRHRYSITYYIDEDTFGINEVALGTNEVALGINEVALGTNEVALGTNEVAGALVDRNERIGLRKVVFKNQRKVVFKNHYFSETVFYF